MGILDKMKRSKDEKVTKQTEAKQDAANTSAKAADKKESAAKKTKRSESKKGASFDSYNTIIAPFISEKAALREAQGTYTFLVAPDANKVQVKRAMKELYGVNPIKVRVINMEGKRVRFGRMTGRRSDWKKAMVTLPKGKSISIHAGV